MNAPERLGEAPAIYRMRHFLSENERLHVLHLLQNPHALSQHGVTTHRDETGTSLHLPTEADEVLERLQKRIVASAQIPQAVIEFRVRLYHPGQGHPPHFDHYEAEGRELLATCLMGVEEAEEGGETHFPKAMPDPLAVALQPGDALLWFHQNALQKPDLHAWHGALEVQKGRKVVMAAFLYARPASKVSPLQVAEGDSSVKNFYCIDDGVPESTIEQLRNASHDRGVRFVHVRAGLCDHTSLPELEHGAMLYRPGTTYRSMVVEQVLCHEHVASFYDHPAGVHLCWNEQGLLFQRAGVPTPRTFFVTPKDRGLLKKYVEHLGGFPVVLKVPGGSLGVGVMRLDSWASLFSVVDQIKSQGSMLHMMAYIPDALHWRVVVVGDRAVASYINRTEPDDFRTYVEDDPEDFAQEPPAAVVDAAVRAVKAQGLSFGGVDVLEHDSGRVYVLEANFPCYFGHPMESGEVDVAGEMLDFLMERSREIQDRS